MILKIMNNLSFRTIGIERLRVVNDGDGITTLVAGFGCPLRCRYCLNPQCFERSAPLRTVSMDDLISEVAIDDLYFQATGGGVVFGGGEPLLQADFIHEFREKCPAAWKVYLESSLAVPAGELRKVINDIDFFLIDIKDMNPDIYLSYTGRSIDDLMKNLRQLAEAGVEDKVTVRIPLIPDFNNEEDRKYSVKVLEKMGFRHFDLFTYDTVRALDKRKKLKQ